MKKLRYVLYMLLVFAAMTAALVGCGAPSLSRPRSLRIDYDSLELNWALVSDARYYTVSINGDEHDSRRNKYSLASLPEGEYTVRVKAVGNGADASDSDWSDSIKFVREAEPGFTFTLTNARREYEVTSMGSASGDVEVPDTYRGKPVTSIGRRAFANRSKLTSVKLGKNIKTIGEQAFYNCSYLAEITVPDSLASIESQAFQSCLALDKPLAFPDSLTSIGASAFAYCGKLPAVYFGKGLTTLGDSAFASCSSLTALVLPDSLTDIGEYAFSRCSSIGSVTFGSGLKNIGARAFYDCKKVTNISLGSSVETVGEYAFSDCESVTAVTIPDSVESVGDGAFSGCVKLTEAGVSLGRNVASLGYHAFYNTAFWAPEPAEGGPEDVDDGTVSDSLVYVGSGDRRWLIGCRDSSATAFDSSDIESGVYAVGGGAFYEHKTLKDVSLPDSVKIVDSYAFYGCEALASVTIGSGAGTVGEYAFYGCKNLVTLYLGEYVAPVGGADASLGKSSLTSIGNYAFTNCATLGLTRDVTIPNTVTVIGTNAFLNSGLWTRQLRGTSPVVYAGNWLVGYDGTMVNHMAVDIKAGTVGISNYAFHDSPVIMSVQMPVGLKYIGRGAFYKCPALQAVILPSGLIDIGDYTFYGCASLSMAELPASLERIGRSAFNGCRSLGMVGGKEHGITLKIPDKVRIIEDYAFYGCGTSIPPVNEGDPTLYTGVDTLEISDSVEYIGNYAFANFGSLVKIEMGDGVKTMGERAFYRCVSLEEIALGSSLEYIPERAFYRCENLKYVDIPDSVESVGKYAFYRCASVANLTVGSGLKTIGDYAFYGCTSLHSFSLSNVESIGLQAFRNCSNINALVVSKKVKHISNHAFYGCKNITVYTEYVTADEEFDYRWNSSNRTVVWGVKLDDTGTYVTALPRFEGSITDFNVKTPFMEPDREGYFLDGWSLDPDATRADGKLNDVTAVPYGTTVYAVWLKSE